MRREWVRACMRHFFGLNDLRVCRITLRTFRVGRASRNSFDSVSVLTIADSNLIGVLAKQCEGEDEPIELVKECRVVITGARNLEINARTSFDEELRLSRYLTFFIHSQSAPLL